MSQIYKIKRQKFDVGCQNLKFLLLHSNLTIFLLIITNFFMVDTLQSKLLSQFKRILKLNHD